MPCSSWWLLFVDASYAAWRLGAGGCLEEVWPPGREEEGGAPSVIWVGVLFVLAPAYLLSYWPIFLLYWNSFPVPGDDYKWDGLWAWWPLRSCSLVLAISLSEGGTCSNEDSPSVGEKTLLLVSIIQSGGKYGVSKFSLLFLSFCIFWFCVFLFIFKQNLTN